MRNKIVIALCSNGTQAGKTTVAEYIQRTASDTVIESFASPIKAMTETLLTHAGLSPEYVKTCFQAASKEEAIPIKALGRDGSPRRLMQTLGTEWGRCTINPTLWVDIMEYKINAWFARGADIVVVDDLRFLNEAEMLANFETYFVTIEGCQGRKTHNHISEKQSDYIEADYMIENTEDITLTILFEQVDDILAEIAERQARYR